jgi:hypothetical protein
MHIWALHPPHPAWQLIPPCYVQGCALLSLHFGMSFSLSLLSSMCERMFVVCVWTCLVFVLGGFLKYSVVFFF